jgi:hypothetical protein
MLSDGELRALVEHVAVLTSQVATLAAAIDFLRH